ncbi:VanZ family protein [Arthrobacter sp. B0490]|uniref:VanZ family protein n=1 Tax=Arthrobacter sp. B0490 TaxID=2058891 RepID=UPI0011B09D70|nr:VanZ family protein [Arthrobacter sp. B0490]
MKNDKRLSIAVCRGLRSGVGSSVRRRSRRAAVVSGALYTGAVLWVTLRPIPWASAGSEEALGILDPGAWLDGSAWTEGRPLEVALNVLMFVPVGVTAGLIKRGITGMVGPLVLTVAIELAQIPLMRISHPRDLAANAVGALVGVVVVMVLRHRQKLRRSNLQGHRAPVPSSKGWSDRPWMADDAHGRQKVSPDGGTE